MNGPEEIADALADALMDVSPEVQIQVVPRMLFNPTPPSFDIYPGTPAESNLAFGAASRMHHWTVRLRVAMSDSSGQQTVLLRSRAPTGPESVREALLSDQTLGGLADAVLISDDSPTGYQTYRDPSGLEEFLGQEWNVAVYVSSEVAT